MKKLLLLFGLILCTLLISCSGSDTYQGEWKATDENNKHFTITFEKRKYTITSEDGQVSTHNYIEFEHHTINSIETYGIRMIEEGKELYIHFPIKNNNVIAFIQTKGKQVLYTLSRDAYLTTSDVYKL
ncbi:hypothetical protein [Myroides odoratimimus]|uniref:hypothetical protein n=1 Tax=Myroides odoratimimus TaxID=76832 RepID=UPI00046ACFC2|nr:hypothetical protein [Myroides odoratimimus]